METPNQPVSLHSAVSNGKEQGLPRTEKSSAQAEPLPVEPLPANEEAEWKIGRREILVLSTLSFISFVVAIDSTILVPALPALAQALNGSTVETFWAGTSYLLANATFLPFIGAVSDIFGRQELLVLSIGLFTLGTILCCVANDFSQLLGGRTVQGIGGGGISTMSLIVLSDIIPLRQRPKYQSVIILSWALGTISGPLIGGVIAQHTTWRWMFYINFPFCGVGIVAVLFVVKLKTKQTTLLAKLLQVDWIGGLLFIAGISSLLMGLTWGGVQYPWSSYRTWAPIAAGGVGIILCLIWEQCVPGKPFLRVSVFSSPSASITLFCTAAQGIILSTHSYYLPFYLASVKGRNSTFTGVCIMLVNLTFLPASIAVGIAMSRMGKFLWAVWSGWAMLILGNGLLVLLNTKLSIVSSIFIFIISGIGQGLLLSSLSVAIQSISRSVDVAFAISMYAFMRAFGMCLGVAISGAIFQNAMLAELIKRNLPQDLALDAELFVPTLTAMAPGEHKSQLIAAYVGGFHGIFYFLVSLAALGGLLSLAIKTHSMDQKLDSQHIIDRKSAEKPVVAEV